MGERFFRNELPEFVPEKVAGEEDSLTEFLSIPYTSFSEKLLKYALSLKDTVVLETWERSGKRIRDYNMYTGVLGTAYLLFKSYQVTRNEDDLKLYSEIVDSCEVASRDSERVSTFLCGYAGVCALGAVVAKCIGDDQLQNRYLTRFLEIRIPSGLPYELLYGRAGYLWSCLFLNKHIGKDCVSSSRMRFVVEEIFREGRRLGKRGECPLMYEWHGKKYWGAAHGLAGIMHVKHMELEPDEIEDVKGTLRYMIRDRFPSGNYRSSEGSESDRLVHWCHGGPGVALTLVKAAQIFGTQEFVEAAMEAGEVVWNRGLLKRVGMCHGISGNTYVFLSLYRLTGKPEYLHRAKAFASFLHDKSAKLITEGKMHGGDRPFSLFEGIGGMSYMFLDMIDPTQALFPGYEL